MTLVGAGILWRVTPVYGGGPAPYSDEQLTKQIQRVVERKERNARWGFGLIAVGTLAQLFSVWI